MYLRPENSQLRGWCTTRPTPLARCCTAHTELALLSELETRSVRYLGSQLQKDRKKQLHSIGLNIHWLELDDSTDRGYLICSDFSNWQGKRNRGKLRAPRLGLPAGAGTLPASLYKYTCIELKLVVCECFTPSQRQLAGERRERSRILECGITNLVEAEG